MSATNPTRGCRATVMVAITVAVAVLTGGLPTPAAAYWPTGIGTASALVGTLGPPTAVVANQTSEAEYSIHVQWTAPAEPSIIPTGYFVERFEGDQPAPACGSDAANLLTGTTYTYRVTSVLASWTATSDASAPVAISVPLTVVGVAPGSGPTAGGTTVTITGSGFLPGASVTFGRAPATAVTVPTSATITATTPPGRGTVDVTITNPDGTTTTLTNGYTYLTTPRITETAPDESPPTKQADTTEVLDPPEGGAQTPSVQEGQESSGAVGEGVDDR